MRNWNEMENHSSFFELLVKLYRRMNDGHFFFLFSAGEKKKRFICEKNNEQKPLDKTQLNWA